MSLSPLRRQLVNVCPHFAGDRPRANTFWFGRIAWTRCARCGLLLHMDQRCLFVCLSVGHVRKPCNNGWTVWRVDSGGLKEPCTKWGIQTPKGRGNFGGCSAHWKTSGVLAVVYAKTAEPVEMPFGGQLMWVEEPCVLMGSRSDAFILSEGWHIGDAAFCQIMLDTCFRSVTLCSNETISRRFVRDYSARIVGRDCVREQE